MIGQNIGKYRVLERVGRGGMGTVYRAIDETLHREVAIKVLNTELNDPAVARRFRAEAVTVARLNHPGIATIYELFQNDGQWLMVMEFVRGETLEALVARKGALPVNEASELCMQALGGLAHAHGLGVVHRDLKPANLMITDAGTVKIMDFGIARVSGTEHLTSAGFMMGTPAYMAPEQVLGQDIDARSDLYAVGVVFFYLTTGKLPFKGDTPFEMAQSRIRDEPTPVRTVRAELPVWVDQVLGVALARAPERRFQSAPVFRESLRRGMANLPIETPAASSIPPELIATAAPRSIPIATPPPTPAHEVVRQQPIAVAPPPAATPPQGADAPTFAAPVAAVRQSAPPTPSVPAASPAVATSPVAPSAAGLPAAVPAASSVPSTRVESGKNSKSMTGLIAGAVVAVLLLAGGGWMWRRSHASAPAPESNDSQTAANVVAPAAPATPAPDVATPAPEAPPAPAPATPVATAPAPNTAAAVTDGSTPATGASGSTSVPSASAASGGATRGSTTAASAAGAAGSAAAPTARGSARGLRGRATPTNDPHLAFADLHALVVNGKKADEQEVSVHFFSGQISVVAQKNGATLALVPYKDFSKATYAHAKSPKWDATLTAPPADVNMPGGLFSSSRHWLTLQAKSTYIILRLNDDDYKKVLQTVTTRMGLQTDDTSGSS